MDTNPSMVAYARSSALEAGMSGLCVLQGHAAGLQQLLQQVRPWLHVLCLLVRNWGSKLLTQSGIHV